MAWVLRVANTARFHEVDVIRRARLRPTRFRRRLENALQAVLSLLSAGSRDEALRRRARRLAVALERIDESDNRQCTSCNESISGARSGRVRGVATCSAHQRRIEGTAA